MAVPGQAGVDDLAGGHLQGGEQRGGAVADVVVGGLLRHPGHDRQDRRGPLQGLHLGLLVDAEHHGVLRRVQIQPDHVADLGLELRVGGELERLHPPGLQVPAAPDPRHRGEPDAQLGGQQPARPVGHPEPLGRRGQRRRHHLRLVDPPRPTRPLAVLQCAQPTLRVAVPPVDHRRARHPHPGRDLGVRVALPGQQHDPGPLRQPGPNPRGPHPGTQRRLVLAPDFQASSSRHTALSQPGTVKSLLTRDTRCRVRRWRRGGPQSANSA